jgi:O-antigen ligase
MTDIPLWITLFLWAFFPDRWMPRFHLFSIPIDGREFLIVALWIYTVLIWLLSTRKLLKRSKGLDRDKNWHQNIPVVTTIVLIFAFLSIDKSNLDSRNFTAMSYTLVLTITSLLTAFNLTISRSKEKVKILLWHLTIFIAFIGIFYTISTFFSLGFRPDKISGDIGRVKGPFFGVANAYFVLIPALAYSLEKFRNHHSGNRWFDLAITTSLIITIIGTGSRGAILALILFLILQIILIKEKAKALLVLILILLLAIPAAGIYYTRSSNVAERLQSVESIDREKTYKASYEIIVNRSFKDNIFGSGYGSYWPWYLIQEEGRIRDTGIVWNPYGMILYKPHSTLLLLSVELGIIGFLYYIYLWYILFKIYISNLTHSVTPLLNSGLLASFIVTFFAIPLFEIPSSSTTWWLYLFGSLFLRVNNEKDMKPYS